MDYGIPVTVGSMVLATAAIIGGLVWYENEHPTVEHQMTRVITRLDTDEQSVPVKSGSSLIMITNKTYYAWVDVDRNGTEDYHIKVSASTYNEAQPGNTLAFSVYEETK